MSGINLNVQNNYAALYNATQTQNNPRVANASVSAQSVDIAANRGEQVTLSAEGIALSQQPPIPNTFVDETPTPTGGGEGIRPPESSTLGGGEGIRPPIAP